MAEMTETARPAPQLMLLGDNAFKRKLAKLSLRALGARVVEAETVEDAEAAIAHAETPVQAVIVTLEETDGVAAVSRLSARSGAAFAVLLPRDDRAARIAAASAGAALTLREPVDWAAALNALGPSLRAGVAAQRASDEPVDAPTGDAARDAAGTRPRPAPSIAPTRWRWYPDEDRLDAGVEARAAMLAPAARPAGREERFGLDAFLAAAAEPSPQILRAAFEAALTVTGETFLVGQVADAHGVAAGFGLFAERRRDGEGRVFLTGVAHRVSVETGRRRIAPRDPETGLDLRDEFLVQLEALTAQLRSERRRCAVLSIELQDIYDIAAGAGDGRAAETARLLLAEAARRLGETLREGDLLARDEGARFLVLQPSVLSLDDVRGLAGRLLSALAAPFALDESIDDERAELCLSASIGATVGPDRRRGAPEMILAARAAERQAARLGPRRFVLDSGATAALDHEGVGRAARRRAVITALEKGAFELLYQPAIDADGRVVALEALTRLRDGEEWIEPEDVVDAVEARGDVANFIERMVGQAAEDLALWRQAFGFAPRLGINLTGPALVEGRAIDSAALALAEHGLSLDRLRIEVSDRRLTRRRAQAAAELRRAQSAGVEIALDAFGGAETSIETLSWAPVDRIKLARSLARAPAVRRAGLIQASVGLARAVGADATLVGVEDAETLMMAFEAGCDEAQGFGVAPPSSITDLVAWFTSERRAEGGAR